MKRIVICGSRRFNDYELAEAFVKDCLLKEGIVDDITILSGGCRGADALGERFAENSGYAVEKHTANWKMYGRAAGPIRNREMATECDLVTCFWNSNSKGTGSMIDLARKAGKTVYIKYVE